MTHTGSWTWETRTGPATALHDPAPPAVRRRTVWEMHVTEPTVVLGSTQDDADLDREAVAARGLAVARRRSGGGAVLLVPGEHHWFDVWLPAGDPLWDDDVGRSTDWLAAVWVDALGALGVEELAVHTGGLDVGRWGRHVCFAGLGPGELTSRDHKVVGVSQRRTREWARFQCLVHRRWDAATTFSVLAVPGAAAAATGWHDAVAEIDDPALTASFAAALAAVEDPGPG